MPLLLQLQIVCELLIYLSVVLMNMVKKNTTIVTIYIIQSIALVTLLGISAYNEFSLELLVITVCIITIKIIIAPFLFMRFIKQGEVTFSASTYLNIPLTLCALLALSIFAQSEVFTPFSAYMHNVPLLRLLLFGSVLMSIFLTINRKGVLSQVIGVLSLENCIYALGLFLGVKQLATLEVGMLFDVLFWIIIANAFIALIFKHYKSIDVTKLSSLKQ